VWVAIAISAAFLSGCSGEAAKKQQIVSDFKAAVLANDAAHVKELLTRDPKILEDLDDTRRVGMIVGATRAGQIALLNVLLEAGFDPKLTIASGRTALHEIARIPEAELPDNATEVTEALIKHGAEPSKPDCFGLTPLHYCSYSSNLIVCRVLTESGAEIEATEPLLNLLPLDIALWRDNERIAQWLRPLGSRRSRATYEELGDSITLSHSGSCGVGELTLVREDE
jgi:hypothetical protein